MEKEISNNLSYLLGVIGGDGTINNKPRQKRLIILDKCKDFHFNILSPILIEEFGCNPKIRFIKERNTWYTIVYSKEIVDILIDKFGHFAGRDKTYQGKIPFPILKGDNEIKISHISGWIDAEGYCKIKKFHIRNKIYQYPCIIIELVNKEILSQLYSLSKEIGFESTKPIFARRVYKNRSPRFYICWNGFEKCKAFLNNIKHPNRIKQLKNVLLMGDQSKGLT